ncbi:MAG: hypothetical protein ACK5OX_15865 [Desertimonas sp.]
MTAKRRVRPADREFRIDAVHRPTPDLHKLAQVFLGMALARAEADKQRSEPAGPPRTTRCPAGPRAER